MAGMNKLREQMVQRFLDALQQDQLPWKACWQNGRPLNAVTGKLYRGVNALWLSYCAEDQGYEDPRWCTYNQAQEKGWQVRQGEHGHRVEFWAYFDLKQKKLLQQDEVRDLLKADPKYEQYLQLRSRVYTVFNAAQIDGIPELQRNHTDIGELRQHRDTLIENLGIGYAERGSRAFYSPGSDTVILPPEASFDDTYSYMATLLHECGHATGHPSRLNRDLSGGFGSEIYAREELRAEIASAFTAQELGLQLSDSQLAHHLELHTAYIQNWIEVLNKSPEELFRAVKSAGEISDYLIEKGEFSQTVEHEISNAKEPNAQSTVSDAHERFLQEAADRGRYLDRGGAAMSRPSSLLRSPSELLKLAPEFPWAVKEQLDEIAAGRSHGLTAEQVAVYAKPEFSAAQMSAIRYAALSGLTPRQLGILAQPVFDPVQMDVIRAGFEGGLTMEQVESYARPELPPQLMLDAYMELRHGLARPVPESESEPEARQAKAPVETMTVVMVEPGKEAQITELPHTLKVMQKAVGGSIEAVYPFDDPVAIVCNEGGKLDGLPLNRGIYDPDGNLYDILAGTFFVAGLKEDDFGSLSPELAQKYREHFKSPERFFKINGRIIGLKENPENMEQALDELLTKLNGTGTPSMAPAADGPKLTIGG